MLQYVHHPAVPGTFKQIFLNIAAAVLVSQSAQKDNAIIPYMLSCHILRRYVCRR